MACPSGEEIRRARTANTCYQRVLTVAMTVRPLP